MSEIVKVIHVVSCMNRGGQETLIMNLFRNINRSNVSFLFLCSVNQVGDYDEEIRQLGGEVLYLPSQRISRLKPLCYFYQISNLCQWLVNNREKFDIIHLHTYHASDVLVHLEACRRAGVKRRIVHSHNTYGPHVLFHKICRMICYFYDYKKFACGIKAGEWLFGSRAVRMGNVTVIKNGINAENFKFDPDSAQSLKEKMGLTNKTIIGHVGRFEEQKNHRFIIEIFSEYVKLNNDSILMLIGRGSLESGIKDLVCQLGIADKVLFLGMRDDVPKLLSAMDMFLFPSLHEGLSVAAIEVQCSGLPILTSDIPSMREAKITDLMEFESLESNASVWARHLFQLKRVSNRLKYFRNVSEAGYDIRQSANLIEKEYQKYYLK